jgi:hypothetical protein
MTTPAHDQNETHRYTVNFPAHEPREHDRHYVDFEHFKRQTRATAKCQFGVDRGGDFSECSPSQENWPHGLEVHHAVIEFALQNGVDLALLERDYPGISNPDEIGAWVESAQNLMWLCTWHHRGHGGVHCATASDYGAEHFVRGLIS